MFLYYYLHIYIFFNILYKVFWCLSNTIYNYYYILLVSLNIQKINILILVVVLLVYFQNIYIHKVNMFIYILLNSSTLYIVYKNLYIYGGVKQLPFSLLIGLNNIHPILYYMGLLGLIILSFNILLNVYNTYRRIIISLFLLVALLLGMYWGVSNAVWAYFWVDDYIEIILLYWCLFSILELHKYKQKKEWNFDYIYIMCYCILIIRMGFIPTRHSFFLNMQTDSYTLYLTILIINYICIVLCGGNISKFFYHIVLLNIIFSSYYIYIGIYIICVGSYCFSIYLLKSKKYLYLIHTYIVIYCFLWICFIPNYNLYYLVYKKYVYNVIYYLTNKYIYTKYIFLVCGQQFYNVDNIINIVGSSILFLYNKLFTYTIVYFLEIILTYSYIFIVLIFIVLIFIVLIYI